VTPLVARFWALRQRLRDAEQRLQAAEEASEIPESNDLPTGTPIAQRRQHQREAAKRFQQQCSDALHTISQQVADDVELDHPVLPRAMAAVGAWLRKSHRRKETEQLRPQYAAALEEIRKQVDPQFDPDQPVPPIPFAAMRDLLPDDIPTAIVQYTLTERQSIALLLTRAGLQMAELPDLNHDRALDLYIRWYRAHRG